MVIEDSGSPNIQRWWNLGIETAIQHGATAVAVLNDDLVIDNETLARLHSELIRTGAAIATPTRLDWGAGLFKDENLFPYTPVIWGCLWMLDVTSTLRPDPNFVWWYGDSDLDIRARTQNRGIAAVDVFYEHFYPGEGTNSSSSLMAQTVIDAETFETKYRDFLRKSRSKPLRKLFIQGSQLPALESESNQYREHFHDYVQRIADPTRDRIVLLEPNIDLHEGLRNLWASWASVIILENILVGNNTEASGVKYLSAYKLTLDNSSHSLLSTNRLVVERLAPSSLIEVIEIPTVSVSELLEWVIPGASLQVFAVDSRVNELDDIVTSNARELILIGLDQSEITIFDAAKKFELRFTGRPWGVAHTSVAFSRVEFHILRTVRTLFGHRISKIVDKWKQLAEVDSRAVALSPHLLLKVTNKMSIDKYNGLAVPGIPPLEIEASIRLTSNYSNEPDPSQTQFTVSVDSNAAISELNHECFERHGIWPLSMSIPTYIDLNPNPTEIVSPIIPGFPYSFQDESAYLTKYSHSYFALTHRKAGWDCFRHVEIMASGSIPLMPDAEEIPKFSMTHYPKKALLEIYSKAVSTGGLPSSTLRQEMRRFFLSHLTTERMARYILDVAGIPMDANVLFIDENLPRNPEYISTLTAIGLKENLGLKCHLMPSASHMYQTSNNTTTHFYGRGFGYTKKVPSAFLPEAEFQHWNSIDKLSDLNSYDFVVIGSVSRNQAATTEAFRNFNPTQIILIHGEDTPPKRSDLKKLKDSGANVFVRSIY